jgi:extracellular elastinolytic metalloproteinase
MATGFLTGPNPGQPLDIVAGYLATHGAQYGVTPSDLGKLAVTDQYTDRTAPNTTHIYLRQTYNGLGVEGADLSFHVSPTGEIIAGGGAIVAGLGATDTGTPPAPKLSAMDALGAAVSQLGLDASHVPQLLSQGQGGARDTVISAPGVSLDPVTENLAYARGANGDVALVWSLVIREPSGQHWYDVNIDASTGQMLGYDDWIRYARYNVVALPGTDPEAAPLTIVTNPWNTAASPFGWHDTDGVAGAEFTDTRGNNVSAQEDRDADDSGGHRPDGGANLDFNFSFDPAQTPLVNQDVAITNLFYMNNMMHDIMYVYGFNEAAGNFQVNNYGKGGTGNDAVQADAQDGSGIDNANFGTPPDGQPGRMQMFLFDLTNPQRDGDLDNEIISHEYGHGITNRLTGGPANAGALQALQSGAMGEGWSDFFALILTQKPGWKANDPRPSGNYVLGNPPSGGGVRRFPYSYDMSIDPLTLNDFNGGFPNNEAHNAGEIWCTVLWDMTWNLINKYGYDPDLSKVNLQSGNQLALKLVLDACKLQPANPTFLQARDAILQADEALNGGQDLPEIWAAFARRGFGLSASTSDSDSPVVKAGTDMPPFLKMTLTPAPAGLVENQPASTFQLATFNDPQPLAPGAYIASVTWSDGLITTATVEQTGPRDFAIKTSRAFQEGGNYTVKVTLTKPGSITVSNSESVAVQDLPLQSFGTSLSAKEGDSFSGLVASFEDTDPDVLANSAYSAVIHWGDDSTNSPGLVLPDPSGLPNHFIVTGDHVFGGGRSTATVTITGPGGSKTVALTQAVVTDSPLVLDRFFGDVPPVEGQPYTSALLLFHDTDPRKPPSSNYTAVIDWGDGSPPTVADVSPDFNSGGFLVSGKHAYNYGVQPYPVSVTITNHSGDSTLVADGVLAVGDAPLTAFGLDYDVTQGVTFSKYLASFQDGDPRNNPLSHYVATIDWGDGTTTQTTVGGADSQVMYDSDGGYLVKGSHAYRLPGTYRYSVIIAQDNGNNTADATGTLTVPPAPISARLVTQSRPQEGQSFTGVVASITSASPLAKVGDFSVTIDWGDGTRTTNATVKQDPKTGQFLVSGAKTYARYGTYNIGITVNGGGGQTATAGGQITVTDAPLTASGNGLSLTSKTLASNVVAASFTDANPSPSASDFTATIDWGDGATTTGIVTPNGRGGFDVKGSHQYERSGSYALKVAIRSSGGSQASTTSTASVAARVFTLSGTLTSTTPVDGSVTPQNQPSFSGRAEPGATVELFAIPAGTMNVVPIGTTTVDPGGAWSTGTTVPLPDGAYSIVARATGPQGDVSSDPTYLLPTPSGGPLMVDTQGPTVQNVRVDPATGQVRLTLADSGTGLNYAGLINPANFTLSVQGGARNQVLHASGITVSPGVPGMVQTATISFGGLAKLGRGSYVLQISAPGITDLAANPLDERYFIPFPGLYTRTGQNYVAQFSSNGQTASPLAQYIPPAELTAAQRYRQRFLSAGRARRGG